MKKKKTSKLIVLLFAWTMLLLLIPLLVTKIETYKLNHHGAYISSEFEILNYDITVNVDKNNRADVTETFDVNIPDNQFNGIYKSIPKWITYYNAEGRTRKKKIGITNLRAEGEKFTRQETNDHIGLQIGSAKTTISPGTHTYKVMYRCNFGKDSSKNYDEFIWNLSTAYDHTKIEKMSVTITMPDEIDENTIHFFKKSKNDSMTYTVDGNKIVIQLTDFVKEPITLNIQLPDGYFVGGVSNYGIICFMICIALLLLAFYSFFSWLKYGKNDNKYAQTVEFYPPDDLDAAQVGFIYGEKSTSKLTAALIISLASKGYVTIEEIGKNQYKIIDNGSRSSKKLSITELLVYQELFKNGVKENVLCQDSTFALVFQKVNACLESTLDKKINDLDARHKMNVTFLLLVLGILAWIGSYLYIQDLNPMYQFLYPSSFLAIFISGFFAIIMKRKTNYGEKIHARILGFRNYLATAEKDQLEQFVLKDPDYFYNILPYTYVLNISKKWIAAFDKKSLSNIDLSMLEAVENNFFMILSE